jgi:integrase
VDVAPSGADRRRRTTRSGFESEKAAGIALDEVLAEGERPQSARERRSDKLSDYLAEWLRIRQAKVGSSLRTSTVRENRRHVRLHIGPALGGVSLRDLDRPAIKSFVAMLRTEKGLSPGTVLNVVRTLSKALADAVEDRTLDHNPALGAWSVKADERERGKTWTPLQIQRFLADVAEDRLTAYWRLMLAAGLRRGEGLGIEWRHVDFSRNIVTIEQSYVTADDNNYELVSPKTRKARHLTLDPGTLDALRRHLERQRFERRTLGFDPEPPSDGAVFVNAAQERLSPSYVSHRWGELCERAGIERIRLHDARHTLGSNLIDQGVPIPKVSQLLGHSSVTTTTSIYAHAVETGDDQTVDATASILDAAPETLEDAIEEAEVG